MAAIDALISQKIKARPDRYRSRWEVLERMSAPNMNVINGQVIVSERELRAVEYDTQKAKDDFDLMVEKVNRGEMVEQDYIQQKLSFKFRQMERNFVREHADLLGSLRREYDGSAFFVSRDDAFLGLLQLDQPLSPDWQAAFAEFATYVIETDFPNAIGEIEKIVAGKARHKMGQTRAKEYLEKIS